MASTTKAMASTTKAMASTTKAMASTTKQGATRTDSNKVAGAVTEKLQRALYPPLMGVSRTARTMHVEHHLGCTEHTGSYLMYILPILLVHQCLGLRDGGLRDDEVRSGSGACLLNPVQLEPFQYSGD